MNTSSINTPLAANALTNTATTSKSQETSRNHLLKDLADLGSRFALAAIFLLAGINKIQYYDANAQFLASGGLPEMLLPFVIIFEVVGALALIVGFQTRLVALAFAGFSIVTALLYHNNLSDQIQFLMFFKNVAIAGGFLALVAHGTGRFSIDSRIK